MSTIEQSVGNGMDRRSFITRTAIGVGGALVVGIELSPGTSWASADLTAATAGGSFGVYVTINPDETITLVCPGSEMGQGIATALPMILAEELMVDWEKVDVLLAGADVRFNRPASDNKLAPGTSQSTGGSNSVRGYHDYLRQVGATIRQQMIWAAAADYSIDRSLLRAENGTVVRCPWHNWPFRLDNGENCHDPQEKLRTYEVRLEGDQVILRA